MQWKIKKAGVEGEDGWGLNVKDTGRNCKNEKKIERQKYLQSDEKNYYVQGGIPTVQEVAARLKC